MSLNYQITGIQRTDQSRDAVLGNPRQCDFFLREGKQSWKGIEGYERLENRQPSPIYRFCLDSDFFLNFNDIYETVGSLNTGFLLTVRNSEYLRRRCWHYG